MNIALFLLIFSLPGMSTSKGRLLSTILFPEQMVFKYNEELPIVVGLLLCYALVCFALSLLFQVSKCCCLAFRAFAIPE